MINECNFIGNVGREPEVRAMQNGKEVATFSLGVTEKWKKDGQAQESTEWVKVCVFSEGLIGVIKSYVNKGSRLYIKGQMKTRKWQDNEGKDRYTTEIVLQGFSSKLILLDSKQRSTESPQSTDDYSRSDSQDFTSEELDDEVPF